MTQSLAANALRTSAAGHGEVEHEGRGQDGQHLLHQQARLELEQLVEGALHLPRVRTAPPVPWHVVCVRNHLLRYRAVSMKVDAVRQQEDEQSRA